MKTLNVFLVLIVMALFAISCAPGIKLSNDKKIGGNIGTNPADMEGLSKAEMRVANAGLTKSVSTMIDSVTQNPQKYGSWQNVVVALTQLTKNPDEKITTNNQNRNFNVASGISYNSSNNNSSGGNITASRYGSFSYNTVTDFYYWDKYDPQHKYPIPISFVKMIRENQNGDLAQSVKSSIAEKY